MCLRCFLIKIACSHGWENRQWVRRFIGGRWELWTTGKTDHPWFSELKFWVANGYEGIPDGLLGLRLLEVEVYK